MSNTPGAIDGVHAAALTPVTADLRIDHQRLAAHCRRIMEQGCDGVSLFGTTGEGPSFGVEERLEALAAVLEAGVDPGRVSVGTAAASLSDAVRLSQGALALGCTRTLSLPPFYFKQPSDDGVYGFFSEMVERCGDDRLAVYLYHIPAFSGVPIGFEVIERLRRRYPDTVVGIKDSSGEWPNAQGLLERFPDLNVLIGIEALLPQAMAAGARGTISGLSNIAPSLVRELCQSGAGGQDADTATPLARVQALLAEVMQHPFIPAFKTILAEQLDDPEWLRSMPPLPTLDGAARQSLLEACRALPLESGSLAFGDGRG